MVRGSKSLHWQARMIMQVSRITNRLIESKTKLDKLALDCERAITSRAVDQKGLYIRLGTLSSKTHRLGVHSIYCHLKSGRKPQDTTK